ncbi:hypothetical protein KX729_28775 [Rhizobium sp. XQZ8]|nr:hypothetical protein [Rhizobium populisoli]
MKPWSGEERQLFGDDVALVIERDRNGLDIRCSHRLPDTLVIELQAHQRVDAGAVDADYACDSVKLFLPSTGAVEFFVSGVATAGVLPFAVGAVVVCAYAVRADAPNSAATKIILRQ